MQRKQATCFTCVEIIEGPQAYFASKRNAEGRAASPRSGDDEELVADSPTPHRNSIKIKVLFVRVGELNSEGVYILKERSGY